MLKTKFSTLSRHSYKLTDYITIHIPTIGEIRETETSELEYLYAVSIFTRTQCDYMVELFDIGQDYTQVDNYDLFIKIFCDAMKSEQSKTILERTWKLLFENVDISNLYTYNSATDNQLVIVDKNGNVLIDRDIYEKLADLFRQITFSIKNDENLKVPEEETKKYIIKRAREKRERNKNKQRNTSSQLDGVILLLVSNKNFKYNFETVKDVTIYDFYCSYRQIFKDKEIDGLLSGYWAGNLKVEALTDDKTNRMIL